MIWLLLAGVALVLFGMKNQDAAPTTATTTTNNNTTPTQAPVVPQPTPTPQVDAPVPNLVPALPVSPIPPTMPVAVPTAPPVFQMPDFAAILAQEQARAQAEMQARLYEECERTWKTWAYGGNPDGTSGKPDWLKTKVADLMNAKRYVEALTIMQTQWK